MPVEVGKTYYFVCHAYYHYIGTVREITGKREADCDHVVRIHNDDRDFTAFLRDGIAGDNTQWTDWGDNVSLTWFIAKEWKHSVPRSKDESANRRRR